MKRQYTRRILLFAAFLLFPVTIWYFSPYLIIQAVSEHIINGSFILFCCMLVASIIFGRSFCAYLCPAGGLSECSAVLTSKVPKQGFRNNIKYIIFVIWMIAVITTFILGKNKVSVQPFYQTDHGISVSNIYAYIIYYGVVGLIAIPSILGGKRTFCHSICWMAPFMVIGSSIGRVLRIPQIHISSQSSQCIHCRQCDKACPMALPVEKLAQNPEITLTECIQCGACVDSCPRKVLRYSMKWRKRNGQ